jgi:hypothetical protein
MTKNSNCKSSPYPFQGLMDHLPRLCGVAHESNPLMQCDLPKGHPGSHSCVVQQKQVVRINRYYWLRPQDDPQANGGVTYAKAHPNPARKEGGLV